MHHARGLGTQNLPQNEPRPWTVHGCKKEIPAVLNINSLLAACYSF